MDQFRDTIDVASEIKDVLPFVDSPRDAIYCFVSIDIGQSRAAPLKVLQQLKADVLILLAGLIPIAVEHGKKAVKRGLSENPFAFGQDFTETHVLTQRTPFLIEVLKSSKHYKVRREGTFVFADRVRAHCSVEV